MSRPADSVNVPTCPRCKKPTEHLVFYSKGHALWQSGRVKKASAEVDYSKEKKGGRELGFYCPECGQYLTDKVQEAKRILA